MDELSKLLATPFVTSELSRRAAALAKEAAKTEAQAKAGSSVAMRRSSCKRLRERRVTVSSN